MSHWDEMGTWEGAGLRREVFFFPSGGIELYGSLFAAADITHPIGVVCCNSWGVEADRSDPLQRSVAIEAARLGGAGMVFHYPGYGDSYGDLADVGLSALSAAASDAVEEASRRCPDLDWILAGIAFGASVACLAQARTAVGRLLFVQPELQPDAYFQRLARRREPLLLPGPSSTEAIDAGPADMAYGYPLPLRIAESGARADDAVVAALADFAGGGTVICHAKPTHALALPERFELVEVPGAWRFGSRSHPELAQAAAKWLGRGRRWKADGQRA